MYRDCPAKLSVMKVILGDTFVEDGVYNCKVIRYIPEKESIYLLAGKTELSVFSLDALYECSIQTEEYMLSCQGYIRERYISKLGKVIMFQIKNGFYKNPVN